MHELMFARVPDHGAELADSRKKRSRLSDGTGLDSVR